MMKNLELAGTYRRRVGASLERIWENVLDWEHLPALHATSFTAVELIDLLSDGWRIRLVAQPGDPAAAQVLRLEIDRACHRYAVTTEIGYGALSEVRVQLEPQGPHDTGVVVDYYVPGYDPARRARIGAGFVEAYERLWDEDEAMMRAREAALSASDHAPAPPSLALGPVAAVAPDMVFAFGRDRFRLVELDGILVAPGVTCPHWLGLLDAVPVDDGCVRCPWHGYRFDVATGRSADGRGMRLAPAPTIVIEAGIVVARRR